MSIEEEVSTTSEHTVQELFCFDDISPQFARSSHGSVLLLDFITHSSERRRIRSPPEITEASQQGSLVHIPTRKPRE
eukprot:scaffold2633_cov73-Cylindrotheca_fusiformis.AAC.1